MPRAMSIMTQFGAYAADFEKTYVDDDWLRLRPYFADDAVYEVKAEGFGGSLAGPDRIFAGIKKSLDGFDRKFDERTIALVSGPEVVGDEVRVTWTVTYRKEGLAPYVLPGSTVVRYRDGKIAYMADSYAPSVGPAAAAWMQANGLRFDPSYT